MVWGGVHIFFLSTIFCAEVISEEEFEAYFQQLHTEQERPPTRKQLMLVMVASGVPFTGAGIETFRLRRDVLSPYM